MLLFSLLFFCIFFEPCSVFSVDLHPQVPVAVINEKVIAATGDVRLNQVFHGVPGRLHAILIAEQFHHQVKGIRPRVLVIIHIKARDLEQGTFVHQNFPLLQA